MKFRTRDGFVEVQWGRLIGNLGLVAVGAGFAVGWTMLILWYHP